MMSWGWLRNISARGAVPGEAGNILLQNGTDFILHQNGTDKLLTQAS